METSPYGRRLLPCVLDELARAEPQRLFAAIPKSADISEGFRDITVADVARCVDFMAAWIEGQFGRSEVFETVSYIGIPDLRGVVVFYAAVKCGYKLLLPSPRNPPSMNLSLMNRTESTKLLYAAEATPIIKPLLTLSPTLHDVAIPAFDDMLNSTPDHYPYNKEFDKAINEPLVVLHSSGSTGPPKPITMTNGSFAVLDYERTLPTVPGREKMDHSIWNFEGEARVYSVFPFFHVMCPVFNDACPVLGPPNMIPDGNLLKHVLRQQKIRALVLVPAVVEQLLNEPNGLDFFRNIDYLCYGGAPMNPIVGDRLSKVTKLVSPFGQTEIFSQPELAVEPEDWQWHEFNPHMQHEMQIYDPNEGTYELVIFADESNKDRAGLYHNLPGVTEYRTKDLFTRHPHKSRLYKYYGRKDDIIVLANGEKFNPLALEMKIQSHPLLKGALVTGNGRTQTALIIEPKDPLGDEEERSGLLKQLWPFVEESNSLASGQGRIYSGKVICAAPEKPLVRTAKGTIVRKLSEEAYKDELEVLYSSTESQDSHSTVELKGTVDHDLPTIVEFVRRIFATSFPPASMIDEDEDFFTHGLDSIQTLEIVASLKRNLQKQSKPASWVSPRAIFQNSSLAEFSRFVKHVLDNGAVPEAVSEATLAQSVNEIVERFVRTLPEKSPLQANRTPNTSIIALIGSTGYLGSNVVATLLKRPSVSRIYCLNRSSDAKRRQEEALVKIDRSLQPLLKKLEYMAIELGKPLFGLPQDEYDILVHEVGVVVYNSWRLDFGHTIRSFEPFFHATGELIKLSTVSHHNIYIVFVSSLTSVGNFAKTSMIPEGPVEAASAAVNTGYAQSKFAAERILTAASQTSGVPVSIVRIGQIGGPTDSENQKWADQPWISSLIRTSRELKCAPNHVSKIDWTPVDTVAAILADLILQRKASGINFANIWSSEHRPWELLLKILDDIMDADDVARLPALKLLDYYDALGDGMETVDCETGYASRISQTPVRPVTRQMLERWLQDWDL
ncbi:acetyl-CoA synthetase-like protein [Hypoxylon sp. FL0890]|nr:acetyl-CoA synthetase-like protein [Hypoxylon sp. FL0890]